MAQRHNHYEAAFEEYLRLQQTPYVAVDETKRSLLGDGSLKSLDFIVSSPSGVSWLVDVKGRRFAASGGRWKNWSTADDLRSLSCWEELFGGRFAALFVFAYNIVGDLSPLPAEHLLPFRGGLYGFVAIRLSDYVDNAHIISPKWGTVAIPARRFRELAAPVQRFF